MTQKVDWSTRNQNWSTQWGNVLDSKSVKIIPRTNEEKEESERSQVCLPIGPGSHDLIREEIRKEMNFVSRLMKAVESDSLEKLDKELEAEDIKEKLKNAKNQKAPVLNLAVIQSQKDQEVRILDGLDDQESVEVEVCKKCYHPKYVDGQVGIHHCSL